MASLLPTTWEVPAEIRSRLGERGGRQRMMSEDEHLLIILHKIPEAGNPDRVSVFFWRNPKGEWRATERGSGASALKECFEDWKKIVDDLEDMMQQPSSSETYFFVVQRTTPLLRSIRNSHRTLQEARETVPDDRALLLARDTAGELERTIELLHTDAQHGLEFMVAKQAEEQAKQAHELVITSHRLNLLVALFLPLTAIASVFGMNLAHGLENWNAPWMFWGTLALSLIVGFGLQIALQAKPKPAKELKRKVKPSNPPRITKA